MVLSIQERNRNNIISRWKKVHLDELSRVESGTRNNHHLLSRILGFIAGDGNIYIGKTKANRHYLLRFFPDHISLVEPFQSAIFSVYGKKAKAMQKQNFIYMTLDSKIIVLDLMKYAKFGVLTWNVPIELLNSPKNKKEWLRAFFDCEAYVGKTHIKVHSVNRKGLEQVQSLLNEFRIDSKLYQYTPKNENWNVNHILIINRREDKLRFVKQIGFNHEVKLNKIKDYLNINDAEFA